MKRSYILMILIAVVALAVVAPLLWFSMQPPSMEARLNTFLTENGAKPEERQAYLFALRHPEVLEKIPCYCGCGRQGHKSNYHCFMQGNPTLAKTEPFDPHGLVCPMCVAIAINAEKMLEQGASLPQIRATVDEAFVKYPHLHPTPTPKPEPMQTGSHE